MSLFDWEGAELLDVLDPSRASPLLLGSDDVASARIAADRLRRGVQPDLEDAGRLAGTRRLEAIRAAGTIRPARQS